MRNGKLFLIVSMALVAMMTSAASADQTTTLKYLGYQASPYRIVDLNYNSYQHNNVVAGIYGFTQVVPNTSARIDTYCIQLDQDINNGWTRTFEIVDLEDAPIGGGSTAMGASKAADIREMWIEIGTALEWDQTPSDSSQAAAIQMAIWEIVHETTDSSYAFDSGNMKVTDFGGASTEAQSVLALVDGTEYSSQPSLKALVNTQTQDFVAIVDENFAVVPLPAAVYPGMALLGFLGVGKLRRKSAA